MCLDSTRIKCSLNILITICVFMLFKCLNIYCNIRLCQMKLTLQHLILHNIVLGKLDFDQIFQLKNLMLVFFLLKCVLKNLTLVYKFLYALS